MGEAFGKRGTGGGSLNIQVKPYSAVDSLPTTGKVNTIAVITAQDIPAYSFASSNPYLRNKTSDLLLGKTRSKGWIESDGSIQPQQTEDTEDGRAAFEVYTKDYIAVAQGEFYTINYTCPTGDWNWMRILEYNSRKKLITEWIQVDEDLNGKTGTFAYTPSEEARYVRLTWNTYNDPNTLVELVDNNVVYTDETTEIGTVWVQLGESSSIPFLFGKKHPVELHPIRVHQYTAANVWTVKPAYAYSVEESAWKQLYISLYRRGNESVGMTGGWVNQYANYRNSESDYMYPGTFRKEDNAIVMNTYSDEHCNLSLTTKLPVDFTDSTYLYIDVSSRKGLSNVTTSGRGAWLYLSEYSYDEYDQTGATFRVGISSAKTSSVSISKADGIYYPRVTCYGADIVIEEIYYY